MQIFHLQVFTWLKYLVFLLLIIALYGVYRYQLVYPSTHNAFVRAQITPVASEISGRVVAIYVKNYQKVHKGDRLFQLDPKPYQLNVAKAQDDIAIAKANIQSLSYQLQQASANLAIEHQKLAQAQDHNQRIQLLKTTVSAETTEDAQRQLNIAQAGYDAALANQLLLKSQLSSQGSAALQLASAQHALELAQFNLQQTTVVAEYDGIISNLTLTLGSEINSNQTLFALIIANSFWVQANFKETELSNINIGNNVSIFLKAHPEEKLAGEVFAISPGIARGQTDVATGLLQTTPENDWVALPQRIPVMIKFTKIPQNLELLVGSSATVKIARTKHNHK